MSLSSNYQNLRLSTTLNYQKIALSGSLTASVPFNVDTPITIPHNLGYVPTAKVWYEPFIYDGSDHASNQIWPLSGYQYGDIINLSVTFNLYTVGYAYLDENNLYVVLNDASGSTVNIPIYYRIYYDA